ncbi:MAG: DegQ family serine endoprotease [Burkholderiales bacterium]|jgi:serine protease Do|nr:DegQ family serine endoprotease [Burkholderiales bacterium]
MLNRIYRLSHSVTLIVCVAFIAFLLATPAAAQSFAPPDFTELYEKYSQAVVSIDVRQKFRHPMNLLEDDPFYEFFRRFGTPTPRRGESEAPQASGSGFIVFSDGYIITNAHVVNNADEVKVILYDKTEYTAEVIGTDRRTDVALLKIDATHLPTVAIGDPERLKVGEWVVAIGKPFGLENTITAGIVSAKGRDLPQENLVPFIQTDAAINPGNSGGPLFNMRGEVVGINSLIYSRTGGYMGLAFAIPIDVAMNIVNQIKISGKVTRGRIGVVIQEVGKDAAEAFGLSSPSGALVNSVEKDGPADKAGILAGDVILKVEGRDVKNSAELPRIITVMPPGKKTTLSLWRGGKVKEVTVTIAEIDDGESDASVRREGKSSGAANHLGLVLSNLSAEQKQQVGIKNGVLVDSIQGRVRGNIQSGDIILAIIQQGLMIEAVNVKQVNDVLARFGKNSAVTLQILRGDTYYFVTIRPLPDSVGK